MIDVSRNILFGKKKQQHQLLNFSYLIKKKSPQGIKIPSKLADKKCVTFYCKILTDFWNISWHYHPSASYEKEQF